MDCEDCNGACCRWILIPFTGEIKEVMELRGCCVVALDGVDTFFAVPRSCFHLNAEGKCKIYEKRPDFCRISCDPGDSTCKIARYLEKERKLAKREK